jgi:ATP/ADP translocase
MVTSILQRISNLLLIRKGEQQQVLYFLILFFFVGAGMALGRGTSEALFFKRYGIEYLPIMYIITSILLSSISLLYAAFVDRLPSEKFYKILFVVLAILLFMTWVSTAYAVTELVYPAFFLIYEVASELLLIHCAVYMNQNLVQTQSKRLAPIILAGHQIGIISGGILLAAASSHLGVENMILLWIALLFMSYITISIWHADNGISPYFRAGNKRTSRVTQSVEQITQGVKLIKTSRLLQASSFSLFFMVISVYVLAYSVNTIYTDKFVTEESLSSFFGILTAVTGALTLLIQLLFTNRLIRAQGIKRVNYIFPLTSICSFLTLLFSYAFPSAIMASFNKETLMPAFAIPVRNIFHTALPSQLQGRAQAVSVIIVIPLGLALAGVFLVFARDVEDAFYYLITGLLCSIAYLIFNNKMNRAYSQEILSNLRKCLFIPENNVKHLVNGNSDLIINELEQGLMSKEEDISLVYARVLIKNAPDRVQSLIPKRLSNASNSFKDQVIKLLQAAEVADLQDIVRNELGTGDAHLDATILRTLFYLRDPGQYNNISVLLENDDPRIKAAAIYGALHYPIPELADTAIEKWINMLDSVHVNYYIHAVELIVPEFNKHYLIPRLHNIIQQKLRHILKSGDITHIRIALKTLSTWPSGCYDDIEEIIINLSNSNDWRIRESCLNASHLLSERNRYRLQHDAIEDQHPNVRLSAVKLIAYSRHDDIAYIKDLLINRYSSSPKALQTMLEYLKNSGGDPKTMQAISIALARYALELDSAREYLKESNLEDTAGASLLLYALQERVKEMIDLSLFSIQSLDSDDNFAVIRAGLMSNDERQFSNACELLSLISNQELAELILTIFDAGGTINKSRHECIHFDSIDSLIKWLETRSDSWLKECTTYFSNTHNNQQHV